MVFVDWSSLQADLINRVAECFLATSDLDQYMGFRAVCRSWRSATDDPKNSPAPRFRPRHWVLIDRPCHGSSSHLFVNTTTGRFLRKELPLLHGYRISRVTADGLLVLLSIKSHNISVLNPFTGYLIRFTAPLPDIDTIESAALVSGSSPSIVLLCKKVYVIDDEDGNDVYEERESSLRVYTVDLDSVSFVLYKDMYACPLIRLVARGIYTNGELGSVAPFPFAVAQRIFEMMGSFNTYVAAETSDDEDTMMSDEEATLKLPVGYGNNCFLLESDGEMLIIIQRIESMEVYKMDNDSYSVERAMNIGNRAIFLCGSCRCISVNADKFPSIDANCIYYMKNVDYYDSDYIYIYDLKYQTEEMITEDIFHVSPHTLIELLIQLRRPEA